MTPTLIVPSGSTALVAMDTLVPKSGAIPSRLAVDLRATFGSVTPGQPPFASIYPDTVDEQLPSVPVVRKAVRVIAPPVAGGNWGNLNACCILSPHRVLVGAAGQPVLPERYGIDFSRWDFATKGFYSAEPPSLSNNLSYGAKLLAVANATVVATSDDLPDQPPNVLPTGYTLAQETGNDIVLQLAPKVFALYAHIQAGTVTVHVGQRVHTGQVLGLLGNSGNSSRPHLHFQLMDGPSPLTGNGLPFVFPSFTTVAVPNAAGDDLVALSRPLGHRNTYPLHDTVVRFSGPATAGTAPAPEPLPSIPSAGPDD
ncbi:MAG TPA: M23 family metallopeptidase [Acidimicrobiia bacterium]